MSGTGNAGFIGKQAVVETQQGNPEALKYGEMWKHDEYRQVAPGEQLAGEFLRVVQPKKGASVIDFGCGTGRGAFMLALMGGLNVIMVDFVNNCLDDDIREMLTTQSHALKFVKADLEKSLPVVAEYGYCTDVMEHIPTEKVGRVIQNILLAAQHVFFSISTVDDSCGKIIGEPLHLTVQPFEWWEELFKSLDCVIHWSKRTSNSALFYVTAWQTGEDIASVGVINTTEDQIRKNVIANINGPYGEQQVHPFQLNDAEVMLLGGGPSMPLFLDEIKAKREAGIKLVTLNGAYNWAVANGLTPSATVIVDARPFNARFVKPVVEGCKYLVASQCDPSVFEGLPVERTFIWHASIEGLEDALKERYKYIFPVPGGSTVLLRAIPLMRMLGFKRFHLYGCDSCVTVTGEHHAYEQTENDGAMVVPVVVNGRVFSCTPWMVSQAQEMQDLIRAIGEEIELEIYGDGLLSYILKTVAERDD